MFDTPAEIQTALEAQDYPVPPAVIERVMGSVQPIVAFEVSSDSSPGATRFGGQPDVGEGVAWPRLPSPEAFGDIVPPYERYDLERARARLSTQFPYAFVGQVDLTQMPDGVPQARLLPDEGRLLFFHDLASYDLGVWTAKVIWDTTPADQLSPLAFADELLTAHREDYKQVIENDQFDAKLAKDYGDAPVDIAARPETSQFIFPEKPGRMKASLIVPDPLALEFQQIGPNVIEVDGEEIWLSDMIGDMKYAVSQDQPDDFYNFAMVGPPTPEQDDPRLDAAQIAGGAPSDWVLLLQVDVAGLYQRNTEGTVYFVVRKDHLAKRDFDHVVAVYQQT
ncbi:MAG: DUF1963 domain-containing protein [Pseudomonadota bacterium]